jgi:hypothetical protein
MWKFVMAALVSAALVGSTPLINVAHAQKAAQDAKSDTKSKAKKPEAKTEAKKLTPQQQKMKDCAAKWQDEKKAKKVSGRDAYRKFMSGCLKG